ncbi:MAG: carbohydrate-binding protein [Heliobacteriaceae bacterium]|nr:carbohydrate-binding protein [Heliobacteriaceae bacterium]MDD4588223.1 carbohydrate-binding protein [Heliobacteriaceae bacterium]
MAKNTYPGGVRVDPLPVTAGQEITVFYSGLLHNSGAEQVYLRLGYGDADNWHQVEEQRMEKLGWGWVKEMPVKDLTTMHFCFRDSANNWDNNNGTNWSIQVHNG